MNFDLDISRLIDMAIAVIVAFGGASGINALRNRKVNKNSLEIENLKKILDTAREERQQIKKEYDDYEKRTGQEISAMQKTIKEINDRESKRERALNSAYRCSLISKIQDCVVIRVLNDECDDLFNNNKESEK